MDGEAEVLEVVTYEDAYALAQDAADAVLESRGDDTVADVGSFAESAAADAVDAAVDEIDSRVDAAADAAADAAVAGVRDEIDAALVAFDDRSAALEQSTVEVVLDSDQYDALATQLRVQLGCSFLALCVLSALFGSLVWSVVIRRAK